MAKQTPLVSVVIVNWNGEDLLPTCIQSVVDQQYSSIEIIVVDNASTDSSVQAIARNFPNVTVIQNSFNAGFAQGCNRGAEIARGEFILFLNTDAWLETDFFAPIIERFQTDPSIAAITPKLLRADDPARLDSCGSLWSVSTWLYHFGYGKDAAEEIYNVPQLFFALKGAVLMIRTSSFRGVGGFDNDFWCYYEETDLCHRLWLAGYTCMYYPKSTAYHQGAATAKKVNNAFIHYHNFKNQLQSFIKNFSLLNLSWILPTHILLMVFLSAAWAMQGKIQHALSGYRAIGWTMQHLRAILKKRNATQKMRRIPDHAYLPLVTSTPSPSFYIHAVIPKVSYADQ